jgi:ribulose-5-phosphate 4-epimerase/fuculose-1-phosphate aldolase
MLKLINKYLDKLESQGIAKKDEAIFLALDAELYSNQPMSGDAAVLRQVFDLMNIGSLLLAVPSEPHWSIICEIMKYDNCCRDLKRIVPMDCETRTFFHDIPVVEEFSPQAIADALSHRKAAVIKGRGIVSYGAFTPEQAFVSFSSTCFSTFVKYFYDSLIYIEKYAEKALPVNEGYLKAFCSISEKVGASSSAVSTRTLRSVAPGNSEEVTDMISEAGRAVVEGHLVDSFFGNISFVYDGSIFISETGSSLDELEGCIDTVPLDGSSSVGITASSELSAHKNIYQQTGLNAILHGHPKFAVVMSMYCKEEGCDRNLCHKACKEKREVFGIPVVPGEIGTGLTGLMNTVPPAIKRSGCVIVYGHGVFSAGKDNFQVPFDMLAAVEEKSRNGYFNAAKSALQHLFDGDPDRLAERS